MLIEIPTVAASSRLLAGNAFFLSSFESFLVFTPVDCGVLRRLGLVSGQRTFEIAKDAGADINAADKRWTCNVEKNFLKILNFENLIFCKLHHPHAKIAKVSTVYTSTESKSSVTTVKS